MTENSTAGAAPASPRRTARDALLLLALTATAILPHGYHYGFQDGAIWLPPISKLLDPSLYPHDAIFFLAQTSTTVFPQLVAYSVKLTRLPLDVTVFLWHLLSIFLVLCGCLRLARRCFARPAAQWAAVTAVWAARLFIIAGTKLNLMDHYLHPRDLATGALLFGLVATLDGRLMALAWIALAATLHPTMALYGAFHLAFQVRKLPPSGAAMCAVPPLWAAGFVAVPNQAWHEVLATRPYLFPLRWHWYEWLSVPVVLFALVGFARVARRGALPLVEHISGRLVLAGLAGTAASLFITTVPAFERLIPAEPMRTLHFVYLLFVLLGGGLLGQYFLLARPGRWLALFLPICLAFVISLRSFYPASPHIEWPGGVPRNAWVEGFDWVRRNTPRKALSALNPMHMDLPGEDSHGFRFFAERSMLADGVKDRAATAIFPGLAYTWRQQVRDQESWREFSLEDFRRLKRKYGVNWIVLERNGPRVRPGDPGLPCPFTNDAVAVCRIE